MFALGDNTTKTRQRLDTDLCFYEAVTLLSMSVQQ